jgi:hypothetical protein
MARRGGKASGSIVKSRVLGFSESGVPQVVEMMLRLYGRDDVGEHVADDRAEQEQDGDDRARA